MGFIFEVIILPQIGGMVVDLLPELRVRRGHAVEDVHRGVFRLLFYDPNPDLSPIEEP
jgi:hypothetical protein